MIAGATTTTSPPSPIRWPKSLYHQMAESGWFRDKRVQLIEGEIVEMAPMGTPHWVVGNNTYRALLPVFPLDRFTITVQYPIDLGPGSEPEPDVAVMKGQPSDYANALPTADSILLVIEVSDSSLAFDRGRKATMYATGGIAEYWIIDISNRTVEIYRDPIMAEGRYRDVTIHGAGSTVTPLTAQGASVRVSALIP